jgi:hypothetical protein
MAERAGEADFRPYRDGLHVGVRSGDRPNPGRSAPVLTDDLSAVTDPLMSCNPLGNHHCVPRDHALVRPPRLCVRGVLRPVGAVHATMTVPEAHGHRQSFPCLWRTAGERRGWNGTPFPSTLRDSRSRSSPPASVSLCFGNPPWPSVRTAPSQVDHHDSGVFSMGMASLGLPARRAVIGALRDPRRSRERESKGPATIWACLCGLLKRT